MSLSGYTGLEKRKNRLESRKLRLSANYEGTVLAASFIHVVILLLTLLSRLEGSADHPYSGNVHVCIREQQTTRIAGELCVTLH